MLDVAITGGNVATPSGPELLDIGIKGETVVVLATSGSLVGSAERVISANEMVVVPGGVDPHVHCGKASQAGDPSIKAADRAQGIPSAGPEAVTKAALFGGTTTIIDFVWAEPHKELSEVIQRQADEWAGNAYCDYGYHVILTGEFDVNLMSQIPGVISAGFPSFRIFTTDVFPQPVAGPRRQAGQPVGKSSLGSIWELLQLTAKHSGVVAIHGEDDDLVMHMYSKLRRQGDVGYQNLPLVHSSLAEGLAFRRVIGLAEHVEGAAIYMLHVSAAPGVEAIASGRQRGVPVYGEALYQYAILTQDNYLEPDGVKYHTYPSLKSPADAESLWRGVVSGDIATFATDEVCTSYSVKVSGRRIDDAVGGFVGVEPRLAVVYTEMVCRRKLGIGRFVEATSTNAAKILGLYPKKGAILVGSDADLAVLDPKAARIIAAKDLHESDYTPWEGMRVDIWPVVVILRGRVLIDNGRLSETSGRGILQHRKILPAVFEGGH